MKTLATILISLIISTGVVFVYLEFTGINDGIGAIAEIAGTDNLSAFPTVYNANLGQLMRMSTTSVDSITTLSGLTSATSLATLSALTSVSTITTGTWNSLFAAALIDGDDINSNIAGRSFTLTSASPDTLDADAELYTESATANIHATSSNTIATSTLVWLSKQFPQAATITRIDCYALDAGTSTIQAEIRTSAISAGSDILYGTGLNCGADEEIASTTLQNISIAAQDWITIDVPDAEPTGSRPRVVFFSITWEWDD